ncbi:sigma-70 family RNA polymerase sigma factor [Arcanobacterium hippocoleae]|uniref:RNA polymerase sigma factor (Sigma-70 family) n=1 Tax=Arcanobacterium hippocoleae TaxID=149017 RepID=A0ABU1SZX6_9ACTO|nr:sigma-70 family RNA polymerase sigma factor [Arcanobacterium hippocoleae]MDR6938672.1 RNA polymerase sigma factor (sigma-70 family) [Arcanobacterium hippocoleae]
MGFITYHSAVGAPIVIEANDQWVEIVAELDRQEYNNEHGYYRQDRKGVKFCSWEVYNAFGNQETGACPSVEDVICDKETAEEKDRSIQTIRQLLFDLVKGLPEVQRAVIVAVLVEQRSQVDVAAQRGVSKAAVSKTLKKATQRLRDGLAAAGVNSADLSGLLMSGAHSNA